MAQTMATIQPQKRDYSMEALHERAEWETLRFPGQWSKMLFHHRPERPTEPNAGFVRYEPGAHHPMHRHDFAQIWYILEGTFWIGGKLYEPGTMIYHADSHYEEELSTRRAASCCLCSIKAQPPAAGRSMTAASMWWPANPCRRALDV
jgi:hypothetical protein